MMNPFKIEKEIEELKQSLKIVAKKLNTYEDLKIANEQDIAIAERDCLTLGIFVEDLVAEYEYIINTIVELNEIRETVLQNKELTKNQKTFISKYERNLNEDIYRFLLL